MLADAPMCRLLGIVANEPTAFRLTLREAPRSLAVLSREHRDGWGVAVYDDHSGWLVERGTLCAHDDEEFHEVAGGSVGEVLVAHVRKRTVGPVSLVNTHPFASDGWVFAHNGTIDDMAWLRERTSARRAAAMQGDTDSELLFAFLLSHFDRAHAGALGDVATDAALSAATAELLGHARIGACTFVLSNGRSLYAVRSGRPLFSLERVPGDAVRTLRPDTETDAVVQTGWSPARHAILLASASITDEPWVEVPEGVVVRVDRLPTPRWRHLPPV